MLENRDVSLEYLVKIRTNKDEIIKKYVTVDYDDILCDVWQEECHGYHTMIEPVEKEQDRLWDEFYGELTLDKINNEYDYIFNLDDEVKAVEILGVE